MFTIEEVSFSSALPNSVIDPINNQLSLIISFSFIGLLYGVFYYVSLHYKLTNYTIKDIFYQSQIFADESFYQ